MSSKTYSRLPTLTEWSVDHIRAVFEAPTDSHALQAISDTFSNNLSATVNGRPLNRSGVENLVLAMRRDAASTGLKVDWERTLEVPDDANTNRVSTSGKSELHSGPLLTRFSFYLQDGSFGGFYTISGLQKQIPGSHTPMDFIRHKTVTVR